MPEPSVAPSTDELLAAWVATDTEPGWYSDAWMAALHAYEAAREQEYRRVMRLPERQP